MLSLKQNGTNKVLNQEVKSLHSTVHEVEKLLFLTDLTVRL